MPLSVLHMDTVAPTRVAGPGVGSARQVPAPRARLRQMLRGMSQYCHVQWPRD